MMAVRNVDFEVREGGGQDFFFARTRGGALTFSKQVDDRMLYLRVGWLACHLAAAVVIVMLRNAVAKDKSTPTGKAVIELKLLPSLANPTPPPNAVEKVTVNEYDQRQLKELVTSTLTSAVIIAIIHYYWSELGAQLARVCACLCAAVSRVCADVCTDAKLDSVVDVISLHVCLCCFIIIYCYVTDASLPLITTSIMTIMRLWEHKLVKVCARSRLIVVSRSLLTITQTALFHKK